MVNFSISLWPLPSALLYAVAFAIVQTSLMPVSLRSRWFWFGMNGIILLFITLPSSLLILIILPSFAVLTVLQSLGIPTDGWPIFALLNLGVAIGVIYLLKRLFDPLRQGVLQQEIHFPVPRMMVGLVVGVLVWHLPVIVKNSLAPLDLIAVATIGGLVGLMTGILNRRLFDSQPP